MAKQENDLDPRVLAAMYAQQEDEIDLLAYWLILWKNKWLIVGVSFLAGVLAAGYSLTLPNIYRAEVLLSPVSTEGESGGFSSLGGMGGLASLAGISMPSSGTVEESLAVLKSKTFLWAFIKDEKLMPILFEDAWDMENKKWLESDPEDQPTFWDAYRLFSDLLSVSKDEDSGLVKASIQWVDAGLAANWTNLLIQRLNQHLRQKAIAQSHLTLRYLNEELSKTRIEDQRKALFQLISQEQSKAMLANTQKQFAFEVIDRAVVPDRKSKPKRSLIVALAMFAFGFMSVVFVLVREVINNKV